MCASSLQWIRFPNKSSEKISKLGVNFDGIVVISISSYGFKICYNLSVCQIFNIWKQMKARKLTHEPPKEVIVDFSDNK